MLIFKFRNPHFEPDEEVHEQNFANAIKDLSLYLRQETVQMYNCETKKFIYIKNSEKDLSETKCPYIFYTDLGKPEIVFLTKRDADVYDFFIKHS